MISLLFGSAALVGGAYGMFLWRVDLLHFLKGFLPLGFFMAGIVAIITGLASLSASPRTPPPDKDA